MPSAFNRPCICGTRKPDDPHRRECPWNPDHPARIAFNAVNPTPLVGRLRSWPFSSGPVR